MSGRVETADGSRGQGTFPAEWGRPPGGQFSEERAAWVARHVRLTPLVARRRLAARDARLHWRLRLIDLEWKRPTP